MMTFFICLPCFAKREIKQTLSIPFTHLENTAKPDASWLCSVSLQKSGQKPALSSQQEDSGKDGNSNFFTFRYGFVRQYIPAHSRLKKGGRSSTPIYLLHEQYRI